MNDPINDKLHNTNVALDLTRMKVSRTMAQKAIASENLVDKEDIVKSIEVCKSELFDLMKTVSDNNDSLVEQLKGIFDKHYVTTSFKKLTTSIKDILKSKDTNVKIGTGEDSYFIDEKVTKSLLDSDSSVIDEKYLKDKLNYSTKIITGLIKYLEDKRTTASVINNLISSIVKELSKESDVDYDKIQSLINEIQTSPNLLFYSNLKINLDEVNTLPKEILNLENVELDTFNLDMSVRFRTGYGNSVYLFKFKDLDNLLFPVGSVIHKEYEGEAKVIDVDELESIVDLNDKYLTKLIELVNLCESNYFSTFYNTWMDSYKLLDNLLNSSFYTNTDRMSHDKDIISSLLVVITQACRTMNVDLEIVKQMSELNQAFNDYLIANIYYYSD